MPINKLLVFEPGLPAQQCINISTITDSQAENTELFEVIAAVNGNNIFGSPVFAQITSSDGELSIINIFFDQFSVLRAACVK